MKKHIINEQNYEEAISALKDILYMYVDIIVQDGDFAELELGNFDPYLYIDAEIVSKYGLLTDGEYNLLRQGSAIALLATIADVYFDDECNNNNYEIMSYFIHNNCLPKHLETHYPQLSLAKAAFEQGRIVKDPNIIKAFETAFSNADQFYMQLKAVLENTVKNCFIELSKYKS